MCFIYLSCVSIYCIDLPRGGTVTSAPREQRYSSGCTDLVGNAGLQSTARDWSQEEFWSLHAYYISIWRAPAMWCSNLSPPHIQIQRTKSKYSPSTKDKQLTCWDPPTWLTHVDLQKSAARMAKRHFEALSHREGESSCMVHDTWVVDTIILNHMQNWSGGVQGAVWW